MPVKCRSLIGPLLLPVALVFPSHTAAASVTHPLVASVKASTVSIPATGGTVSFKIKVRGAQWCGFSSVPSFARWNGRVNCGSRTLTRTVNIPANTSLSPRKIRFSTQVRDSNLHDVWRRITVTEKAAPTSVDLYSAVSSYALYGNGGLQAIGDCTLATVADLLQTWGATAPLVQGPFLTTYTTLVGGPGGPNVGIAVPKVLNYWQSTGIDGYRISTWRTIQNYRTQANIEDAVEKFGALYVTINVPSADAAATSEWSTVEAPAHSAIYGPHAVALVGYDASGPYVATWGTVQHVTWAWWFVWGTGAYGIGHSDKAWTPDLALILPGSTPTQPVVVTPGSTPQPVQTSVELDPTTTPGISNVYVMGVIIKGVTGLTTGTVTITDNGSPATCVVTPVVTMTPTSLTEQCELNYQGTAAGSHLIAASYSGDSTFAPSGGSTTVLVS